MLKIGLIGCGGMGNTHNIALKQVSGEMDMRITAVSDLDRSKMESIAEFWPDAVFYPTGMDLIHQADVSAVYICLPSYMHKEHMIEAVRCGKDVFCEKPVCLTEKDTGELMKLAAETDRKIFIGHVIRFSPEYLYLKDTYDDGRWGKLISLDMSRSGGIPKWGYENWFLSDDKSGSVILDLHIHDIDFLSYLFGEDPRVITEQISRMPDGMINHIHALYRCKDTDCSVTGHWDRAMQFPFMPEYTACFEGGTLLWKNRKLTAYPVDAEKFEPELRKVDTIRETEGINLKDVGPYYIEDRYFVDCLIEGKPVERCTLPDSLHSVMLCLGEKTLAERKEN